jgi:hypothetical protein
LPQHPECWDYRLVVKVGETKNKLIIKQTINSKVGSLKDIISLIKSLIEIYEGKRLYTYKK